MRSGDWNNLDLAGASALPPVQTNRKRVKDLSDDSSVEMYGKKFHSQFAKDLLREQKKENKVELKRKKKEELHNIRKAGTEKIQKKISESSTNKRRAISLDALDGVNKKRGIEYDGLELLSESDFVLERSNNKRATRKKIKKKNRLQENHKSNTSEQEVVIELNPEDYIGENNTFSGSVPKRTKSEIPLHSFHRMVQQRRIERTDPVRRSRRNLNRSPITYGKGLENEFIPYAENIVYEYYDDPNEICDRLQLLVASKVAGNSNHQQEINSIIEELRERNIIE